MYHTGFRRGFCFFAVALLVETLDFGRSCRRGTRVVAWWPLPAAYCIPGVSFEGSRPGGIRSKWRRVAKRKQGRVCAKCVAHTRTRFAIRDRHAVRGAPPVPEYLRVECPSLQEEKSFKTGSRVYKKGTMECSVIL